VARMQPARKLILLRPEIGHGRCSHTRSCTACVQKKPAMRPDHAPSLAHASRCNRVISESSYEKSTYLYESLSAIAKRILSKELRTCCRRAARTFLEMPPERLAAASAKSKSAGTKFILFEIQMPIDCVRVSWQAPGRDAFASVLFCTSMSQRATPTKLPKVHRRRPYIFLHHNDRFYCGPLEKITADPSRMSPQHARAH